MIGFGALAGISIVSVTVGSIAPTGNIAASVCVVGAPLVRKAVGDIVMGESVASTGALVVFVGASAGVAR